MQDPVYSWKAGPGEVMTVENFVFVFGITKCRSIRLKVRSNNFKMVTRLCDEFRKFIERLMAKHYHLNTLCLDYQKWNYKTLRLMRMNVIVGLRFCDEFNKLKQVKSY